MCAPLGPDLNQKCVQQTCVVDCSTGADAAADDALCAGLDTSLTCSESAGNVCVVACVAGQCPNGFSCFDQGGENACLPTGTFPGSPCAGGNTCSSATPGLALSCVGGTCAIDCDGPGDPAADDAYCAAINPNLTCAESIGGHCVVSCESNPCPSGFSCFDSGGEHACLPTGSFPGSPCADFGTCGDLQLPGGGTVPQQCTFGVCAVDCETGNGATANDQFCAALHPGATCSESAGNVCVDACDTSGQCSAGFSCLNPGGENACLPDGTFPGSACAGGTTCNDYGGLTQDCVGGVCAIDCATDNTVCANFGLTCSPTAGNICVVPCDSGGNCPSGYFCPDPGGENACLPL
jgi:hypothetical protein